jgi:transcriptional regulator with XRE-family HTH domain
MSDTTLTRNLAYLCGFYSSIADVCRRIGINRQQFNKYLSGNVRPSRHNMRRICDFFGVTESELLLEHERFSEIVSLRNTPVSPETLAGPLAHAESLFRASQSLDRYVGYYFRYFYSFGHPGYIVKSLARLTEEGGRYYWKNIEIWRPGGPEGTATTMKYVGTAVLLGERIFIVEYESILKGSITLMTLYPCYQTRITHLRGIQTGAPTFSGRKPGASLVLMEYLGRTIRIRDALRTCGLYADGDPAIAPHIQELIENRIPEGSWVLEAEEL